MPQKTPIMKTLSDDGHLQYSDIYFYVLLPRFFALLFFLMLSAFFVSYVFKEKIIYVDFNAFLYATAACLFNFCPGHCTQNSLDNIYKVEIVFTYFVLVVVTLPAKS